MSRTSKGFSRFPKLGRRKIDGGHLGSVAAHGFSVRGEGRTRHRRQQGAREGDCHAIGGRGRRGGNHCAHARSRPEVRRLAPRDVRGDHGRRRPGAGRPGRPHQARGPGAAHGRGRRSARRAGHRRQQRRSDVPETARRIPRQAGTAHDRDACPCAIAHHAAGHPRNARAQTGMGAHADVAGRRSNRGTALLGVRPYGWLRGVRHLQGAHWVDSHRASPPSSTTTESR
jgi:hypothetical protein